MRDIWVAISFTETVIWKKDWSGEVEQTLSKYRVFTFYYYLEKGVFDH